MKTVFPNGLIKIQIASQVFDAEYKGIADRTCIICSKDEKCNVFKIIGDAENYPNCKNHCTLSFGLKHSKVIKVVD